MNKKCTRLEDRSLYPLLPYLIKKLRIIKQGTYHKAAERGEFQRAIRFSIVHRSNFMQVLENQYRPIRLIWSTIYQTNQQIGIQIGRWRLRIILYRVINNKRRLLLDVDYFLVYRCRLFSWYTECSKLKKYIRFACSNGTACILLDFN